MKIDGLSFNADWVKSKTEEEFLAEAEINKDHWYSSDKNRVDKLKDVYQKITGTKPKQNLEKPQLQNAGGGKKSLNP